MRGRANFAELSDDLFAHVLDLLAGRYPSEEFAELRPRIVWDRVNDVVRGRDGVATSGRHQRRHHPRPGAVRRVPARRHAVGELDEEMVYESRPGETFLLGASTWRIEDITFERVTSRRRPASRGRCRSGTATAPAGHSPLSLPLTLLISGIVMRS